MTTWNVTVMNDRQDDGVTFSFQSVAEALACKEWAEKQGAYFVQMWK